MSLTKTTLPEFEALLQTTLDRYLCKNEDPVPPLLAQSIHYSVLTPGKRIRPRLLLACAEMIQLPPSAALPPALALEMIHCFTLIHDDLPCMDDDDFRRGLPSNHKKFGEDVALLAGDALIALAMEVFLESSVEPRLLLAGLHRLIWATGPRGVVGGQTAEKELITQPSLDLLRRVHQKKTGALFSAALLIPKDLAGISDDSQKGQSLIQLAQELGQAFQMADDLEDRETGPHSVLHYLPPQEVASTTIGQLKVASDHLRQNWGEAAQALTPFTDEMILKIELALKKV